MALLLSGLWRTLVSRYYGNYYRILGTTKADRLVNRMHNVTGTPRYDVVIRDYTRVSFTRLDRGESD